MKPQPAARSYVPVCIALLVLAALLAAPALAGAQEQGTPIEITGVVSEIGSGTMTVAGMTVDVSGVMLGANITPGVTVRVIGILLPNNVVVARVIIIVIITDATATPQPTPTAAPEQTPEATPSATAAPATPTPNPDVVIVIEGPVTSIVVNIITIYNISIIVDAGHPILDIIDIGDVIHVEGIAGPGGVIIATVIRTVPPDSAPGVTVSVDGPIEAIINNIVIINGIRIRFAPDDPRLVTLRVGDFLSVQGYFEGSGTTIVLVVVNIIIINNIIIDDHPYCWYHDRGMGMGHWHCDGMGMGMGMGMGDGMGMGMGGG